MALRANDIRLIVGRDRLWVNHQLLTGELRGTRASPNHEWRIDRADVVDWLTRMEAPAKAFRRLLAFDTVLFVGCPAKDRAGIRRSLTGTNLEFQPNLTRASMVVEDQRPAAVVVWAGVVRIGFAEWAKKHADSTKLLGVIDRPSDWQDSMPTVKWVYSLDASHIAATVLRMLTDEN